MQSKKRCSLRSSEPTDQPGKAKGERRRRRSRRRRRTVETNDQMQSDGSLRESSERARGQFFIANPTETLHYKLQRDPLIISTQCHYLVCIVKGSFNVLMKYVFIKRGSLHRIASPPATSK